MPRIKRTESSPKGVTPPALTLEGREDQLAALAYNLAEQRLRDGTASNTLIEQVMKHGSYKSKLEIEKLKRENDLLVAKVEAIKSAARIEELYVNAMNAMKAYTGEAAVVDEPDQNIF